MTVTIFIVYISFLSFQDQKFYNCSVEELPMKTIDKYQFNQEACTHEQGIQTYVANHIILKRPFTLKLAHQGPQSNKDSYNYLIKEAQVLKKLIHPNIYKCHKLLRSKNNFYVIFDPLEGETLQSKMKEQLTLQKKMLIIKQVIEAVLAISSMKIAYLTLNPSNIMVAASNKIILKNFGLVEEFEEHSQIISLPVFAGKMTVYSPPELDKGKIYINSDEYSLGMLIESLFERDFDDNFPGTSPLKIQYDKQGINVDLSLDLLADLASKLNIKDPRQRSRLVDFLKSYTRDKFLLSKRAQNSPNQPKSPVTTIHCLNRDKNSLHVSSREDTQLSRTKSSKSISDIGDKRQVTVGSVEQLVLIIVKKRNFVLLLLKMSEECVRNRQASLSTSISLAFLLAKKATLEISQLTKFVKQGISREMSINSKLKEHFHRTQAYTDLCDLTSKQMITTQQYFQQLLAKVKLIPSFAKNEALQSQVKYERLSNFYLRRTVLEFLLQLQLLSTQQYVSVYGKEALAYIYAISLISDFQHYNEMHDCLFTDGLCGLWKQPFMQQLLKMDGVQIVELIEINSSNLFSEQTYKSPLAVKNAVTIK